MKKRWISLLLAMVMLFSVLPVQAVEAEDTEAEATESAEVLIEEEGTVEEEPVCTHGDTVTDAAAAATCTESGLTEGSRCAACGEILTAQEVIPAAGHSWVDADYETPKTCAVCGVTEGEPLEQIYVEENGATCDTAATRSAAPVVQAGNAAASGKVQLTWEAVDGAVKYRVYRSAEKNGDYKNVFTTEGTAYSSTAGTPVMNGDAMQWSAGAPAISSSKTTRRTAF